MTHDEKREAVARLCYVPIGRHALTGERAFEFAAKAENKGSATARGVAEAYARADAILALPPATSEIGADYRRGLEDAARVAERFIHAKPVGRYAKAETNMAAGIASAIRSLSAAPTPQAGDGWRPIETAPRNGEIVLIWTPETHTYVTMGRYWIQDEAWADEEGEQAFPTHWRPRPEPPAEPDTSGYAEWADDAGKGDGA